MATKPKAKPATTSKPVSKPVSKPAPKAAPKAAPKPVPKPAPKPAPKPVAKAAPKIEPAKTPTKTTKEAPNVIQATQKKNKVILKTTIAPVIVEKPKPKTAVKPANKIASKPEPVKEPKTLAPKITPKTEVKPQVKKTTKSDTKTSVNNVQKPAVKAEVNTVLKTAPPVAPKMEKWQEIRVILEKIKEDTLREIKKSVKNGTDAAATNEPGGDIYDQASSERDRELGLLLGDREREKLHSIDEALFRIDEGEYGICEECDDDIPIGRLKAMPFTRHCVKCKSDLEKLMAQTKRFEEDRAYREIPLGSEEEDA